MDEAYNPAEGEQPTHPLLVAYGLLKHSPMGPALMELFKPLIESALGKMPFGLDYHSYDPTQTLESNLYESRKYDTITRYFGTTRPGRGNPLSQVSDEIRKVTATNINRMLGYGPIEARAATDEKNYVQDFLVSMLVDSKLKRASNQITDALYNRSVEWDPSAVFTAPSSQEFPRARNYLTAGGVLLQEVLGGAARGDFGGMSMEDVGTVARRMINTGGFDFNGDFIKPSSKQSPGNIESRVQRFTSDLNQYTHAINALQDVINGPVSDLLDSFEKLTGSKLTATTTGRVDALSYAMRNVMRQGVIDAHGLASLTSTQYGFIAPFGGTLMQASAAATATAAALSYGVGIEGLNDLELGTALAHDNARRFANGTQRAVATAYVHWRQKQRLADNADVKDSFIAAMRKGGRTLDEGVNAYLRENAGDVGYLEGSAAVTSAMADPTFLAYSRTTYVSDYRKQLQDIANAVAASNPKMDRGRIVSALTSTYDPVRMQQNLVDAGLSSNAAAAVVNSVEMTAMNITGADTVQKALGVIGSAEGAVNTLTQNLAGDTLRRVRGVKRAQGLDGIVQTLMAPESAKGGPITIARLIKAYMGVDGVDESVEGWADTMWSARQIGLAAGLKKADEAAAAAKARGGELSQDEYNKIVGAEVQKATAESRKDIVGKISNATGISVEQIERDFDAAMKYGDTGISILTASISNTGLYEEVKGKDGKPALRLRSAEEQKKVVGAAKSRLYTMLGDTIPHTLKEFQDAAADLNISEKDVKRMYLAHAWGYTRDIPDGGLAIQVTDKEIEKYESEYKDLEAQYRKAHPKVKEINQEELAAGVHTRMQLQRRVDAIRAAGRQDGKQLSDSEVAERLKKEIESGDDFKAQVEAYRQMAGFKDIDALASSVSERDGVLGFLDRILKAIQQLKTKP